MRTPSSHGRLLQPGGGRLQEALGLGAPQPGRYHLHRGGPRHGAPLVIAAFLGCPEGTPPPSFWRSIVRNCRGTSSPEPSAPRHPSSPSEKDTLLHAPCPEIMYIDPDHPPSPPSKTPAESARTGRSTDGRGSYSSGRTTSGTSLAVVTFLGLHDGALRRRNSL